jgi:hypothetical protein
MSDGVLFFKLFGDLFLDIGLLHETGEPSHAFVFESLFVYVDMKAKGK